MKFQHFVATLFLSAAVGAFNARRPVAHVTPRFFGLFVDTLYQRVTCHDVNIF